MKAKTVPGVVYMLSTAVLSALVSVARPSDQELSSSTRTNPGTMWLTLGYFT